MRSVTYTILLLTALIIVPVLTCRAQNVDGSLIGTVVDSTGARVASAGVVLSSRDSHLQRSAQTNSLGEFRFEPLAPGEYRVLVSAGGFADSIVNVRVAVSSSPSIMVRLLPQGSRERVDVRGERGSLESQPLEIASSVQKATISASDLANTPLAHRSFANIAYLAPMTEPVEPSDPTKARITAVSFAGSSGLNVDLSVDGGDNNDDYIGGFLQNYSPDSIEDFAVRTAQFDADTSRTNGGSIIISTRRGGEQWHGSGAFYWRGQTLNARNDLDNPEPNPKQPFARNNEVGTFGGPLQKQRLWFFSSLEYVHEDASIAYSARSLTEFNALAALAAQGLTVPRFDGTTIGVPLISVPTSTPVPFRDTLFTTRIDWSQLQRSQWFLRGSLDRNRTENDLVQQAALPSAGATTNSNYANLLVDNQFEFSPAWLGSLTMEASEFHHHKLRNSNLGFALAFPFSASFHTTSGFETFGDNEFITPITAFPIVRDQQKYQFRYDVSHLMASHAPKFGVNFIHEPVLGGALANNPETIVQLPTLNPSQYSSAAQLQTDINVNASFNGCPNGGGFCPSGNFSQNIQRLGFYAQDAWRITRQLTINYGLRYDTTFGLFQAEGASQARNPAYQTLKSEGLLLSGVPHDYRRAFAPRLGIAYSPGDSQTTVVRAGFGMYYNDLSQNGWVDAFRSANAPQATTLQGSAGGQTADQGFVIDPRYHTPYAIQASLGVEHQFANNWRLNVFFEHTGGEHQYRRYEYASGFTLPALAPNVSVFKTDNRSSYNGAAIVLQHAFSKRFEMTAHYTFAHATTWGAGVGELFDYVNGVTNVNNPFGPGDHGPSGEDVRHRFVLVGRVQLPYRFEVATLAQFESARPFTLTTPVDINNDGITGNDRAVVNGVPTSLDEFRGSPLQQVDLRVSRAFVLKERVTVNTFVDFFNLFNRQNAGNNYVTDLSALPVPVNSLTNATVRSLNDLRFPAGALGDFFGPGTTVGIPFAAQLGLRVTF